MAAASPAAERNPWCKATAVDDFFDAAEVSKRTFHPHFASKEDVALAAELELWDAYVATVTAQEIRGPILDHLRRALCDCLTGLGEDWARQFRPTRGLVARSLALRNHSVILSMLAQDRLVEHLEHNSGSTAVKTSGFGCSANCPWAPGVALPRTGSLGAASAASTTPGGITVSMERVNEAFDALPGSLTLTAG